MLKGTLSSAVLTFGTPDEVKAEIRTRMDTAKRWGGAMITPNNCPDINTPYANFRAFLDTCEEYGRAVEWSRGRGSAQTQVEAMGCWTGLKQGKELAQYPTI